ncbi:hypothetical protein Tco_0443469 [Tanacetum coccineum]
MDNRRPRISSYSPLSRSSNPRTTYRPQRPKKTMKSIWVKKGSTVGSQAVLLQTVKKSAMINPKQTWKPKGKYLDSVNREVVTALAAEEEHSTSPHSRAASSARDAQGTPTQSAAHSQRTASVQGTASFHGTATPHDSDAVQGTDTLQGTAAYQEASKVKSEKQKNWIWRQLKVTADGSTITPRPIGLSNPSSRYKLNLNSQLKVQTKNKGKEKIQAELGSEEERKRLEELKKTKPKLLDETYFSCSRNKSNDEILKSPHSSNRLGLMLLGDLTIIWETAESSDDDFWKDQEEWEIIRWRKKISSIREVMIRMPRSWHGSEDGTETAITH